MIFENLQNRMESAEVWCPGPLYNTVWALCQDGRPAVVHATKRKEVAYDIPPRPRPRIPLEAVRRADAVRSQAVALHPHLRRYKSQLLLPLPTDEQLAAAQYVSDWDRHNQEAHRTFLEAHYASTPLSVKRLVDLAKEEDDSTVE